MAGVSTIALLERKTSISRDLFSRCWRDVHGIMAARIPGFDSFIQHHGMPMSEVGSTSPEPFEGIAGVTYTSEANRQGLIESDITPHIHPDEQNVFRRALLYNLGEGEHRDLFEPSGEGGTTPMSAMVGPGVCLLPYLKLSGPVTRRHSPPFARSSLRQAAQSPLTARVNAMSWLIMAGRQRSAFAAWMFCGQSKKPKQQTSWIRSLKGLILAEPANKPHFCGIEQRKFQ